MMSEEYPIMIIRGLPMILICEIMITIKKNQKCTHYQKHRQGRVKLREKIHRQDFRPT
jgi:hypothetical protein